MHGLRFEGDSGCESRAELNAWVMTTNGEWNEWTYGIEIRGWEMECGNLKADIRQTQKDAPYYLTINRHHIANGPDLEDLKHMAEDHFVKRISAVLPAYRVIRSRMRARRRK